VKPLLIGCSLALSALCITQWLRESAIRSAALTQSSEAARQIADLQSAATKSDARLTAFESEISRLTALQQETAAALADANARLKSITPADPATTEKLRADLTARNEAIATQNDALKKLAAERDNLVRQLNDRTREWNELVRKSSRRPSD
jgi:predicted RNase H-like nuclease (RuvC/YqgF family)